MAIAYSTDWRERAVLTIEGASSHQSAEIHRVSVSFAISWHQSWRCSGSVEARPSGGSHSPLDHHVDEILANIEEWNDRALDEIVLRDWSDGRILDLLGRHSRDARE